jgi:hypothetical protein
VGPNDVEEPADFPFTVVEKRFYTEEEEQRARL